MDPSQPPPFSMPSKFWKLYGKAKSYCIAVSCVTGSLFEYIRQFHSDFFRLHTLREKYNTKIAVCRQKQRRGRMLHAGMLRLRASRISFAK